ncbi:YhcN/YlaJ family sporulation lipoprotein [Ammoniphilus resinae]|uniref:Lipoprotein n=1 Tax=Ammoniphilus resinae TaxID=861532 RepID=A0ABS4GLB2_9BACL|nr:YhcN/YlaJ family sporulation lipoprotein [Ammoniphilus resinae]MBP1931036.1 hypothetical protein [Ammoniphilus resinae]
MKKIAAISLTFLLSLSLLGCNDDQEKAKGEAKKTEKQTVNGARVTANKEKDRLVFNHAASIKIKDQLQEVPGLDDPIVVVHGKDAIIAYHSKGNPKKIEKDAQKKLKKDMPTYYLHFVSDRTGYEKVKRLYHDTIESEGRPIENLSDHFNGMIPKR